VQGLSSSQKPPGPEAQAVAQVGPQYPGWQAQVPSPVRPSLQVPFAPQAHGEQLGPKYPTAQASQTAPVQPVAHEQAPEPVIPPSQVPCPLQDAAAPPGHAVQEDPKYPAAQLSQPLAPFPSALANPTPHVGAHAVALGDVLLEQAVLEAWAFEHAWQSVPQALVVVQAVWQLVPE